MIFLLEVIKFFCSNLALFSLHGLLSHCCSSSATGTDDNFKRTSTASCCFLWSMLLFCILLCCSYLSMSFSLFLLLVAFVCKKTDGTQSGDNGSSDLAPIMIQESLCPIYANKFKSNVSNICDIILSD